MTTLNLRRLVFLTLTACALVALISVWPSTLPAAAGEHHEGTWIIVDSHSNEAAGDWGGNAYLLNTNSGELWVVRGDLKKRVKEESSPAPK